MLVVGFDLETTGINTETDKITEIGAVLWDTDLKAPVSFFSSLIRIDESVTEQITKLTGIHQWMLDKYGENIASTLMDFKNFMLQGKCLIAHNGKGFDFPLLKKEFERHDVDFPEMDVIDTCVDVPYPESIATRKLVHLAAEHGFVNPFPHRAVTDVLTMMNVMSHYDFDSVLELSKQKDIELRALVSFNNKDLAKNLNYRFSSETKHWTKRVKESQIGAEEEKAKSAGFSIVVL